MALDNNALAVLYAVGTILLILFLAFVGYRDHKRRIIAPDEENAHRLDERRTPDVSSRPVTHSRHDAVNHELTEQDIADVRSGRAWALSRISEASLSSAKTLVDPRETPEGV